MADAPRSEEQIRRSFAVPAEVIGPDDHDDQCESEFINPPGAYGPCDCAYRRQGVAEDIAASNAEAYEHWKSQQ